jgi:hypothetical protein|tara:strand:+ start:257 stop:523 length:267 start_codon:yes stop_codon:yes gene_type:complete
VKVKDLIKELLDIDPELDCYVYADHGQTEEQCHGASISVNQEDKNGYYIESSWPLEQLNEDGCEEWDLTPEEWEEAKKTNPRFCVIYA